MITLRCVVILLLLAGCTNASKQAIIEPPRASEQSREVEQALPAKLHLQSETISFTDLVDNHGKWKSKVIKVLAYFRGQLPLKDFADNTGRFHGALMFGGDDTSTEIPLSVSRLTLQDVPNAAVGDKLRVKIEIDDEGKLFIIKMARP